MTETDLESFWGCINSAKSSSTIAAVENFCTREPAPKSIPQLFAAIGRELGVIIFSEKTFHFFSNPDIQQLHFINCANTSEYYEVSETIEYRYIFDANDPLRWSLFTFNTKREGDTPSSLVQFAPPEKNFPIQFLRKLDSPKHIALAPFCRHDKPFGYYVFCWYNSELPILFLNNPHGERLREGGVGILDYTHRLVTYLISNHYSLHRDTYLPSFQRSGLRPSCILFADIRNFTPAFEISHLMSYAGEKYRQLLVGFLKAYLEAASLIIAEPGIGRIDKFMGDGIMATFGEYIVSEQKDLVACLLGLYASVVLQDVFAKLYRHLFQHPIFEKFRKDYNYVLDLKLGIGMNYGEVMFDYFGSTTRNLNKSNLIGGYLEYTVVGDHVNTAQRLESLASKPVTRVSILERGQERKKLDEHFIAPIVTSRTMFMRLIRALMPVGTGSRPTEDAYKSSFFLKGKGSAVEAYEIFPKEVNSESLILILQELGGETLCKKIRSALKDGSFCFDDTQVKDLTSRYFP